MIYFVTVVLFVLALAPGRAVFYGNVAFSILVLSTKKRYASFLEKVLVFQKICFNFFIKRTYLLSVGFKIKPVRKRFFCAKTKTNSNFALKPAERSNRPFSDYLMNHLFQTPVLFNM